jgi:hypothetical protein
MSKKDNKIYVLQDQVWRLESEMAFLRDELERLRERDEDPDPLRSIKKRHERGTLKGHVLTAETFGTLVERFLVLEQLVVGDEDA